MTATPSYRVNEPTRYTRASKGPAAAASASSNGPTTVADHGGVPTDRHPSRRTALWVVLPVVFLVALMAFPGSSSFGVASSGSAAAPASGAHATFASLPAATTAASATTPALATSGEPPGETLGVPASSIPVGFVLPHPIIPYTATTVTTSSPKAVVTVITSAAAPAPSASNPCQGFACGIITGYIYDRQTDKPLAGVTVQAESNGQNCPTWVCLPNITNANGFFRVVGPAGPVTLQYSKSGYLTNYTNIPNLCNGCTVNLENPLFMVEEAKLVDTQIRGDDPSHELVKCSVQISSNSRNGTVQGYPNITVNNGRLQLLYFPPMPSIITFAPGCSQYATNSYWVNGTPGASVSLYGGVAYLPVNTLVQVSVEDSILHGYAGEAEIEVCSALDQGVCGIQGATTSGVAVKAWGPPGYDTLKVWAQGSGAYGMIENITSIGYVPPETPGHIWKIAQPVYLVDMGVLATGSDLSFGKTVSTALQYWGTGDIRVTMSSLDGYEMSDLLPTGNFTQVSSFVSNCIGPSTAIDEFLSFPLRNEVGFVPDTTTLCSPFGPTWPIPDDLPVWQNDTIANVSVMPNLATGHIQASLIANIGLHNLTPGTYIQITGNCGPVTNGCEGVGATASSFSTDQKSISGPTDYSTATTGGQYPYNVPKCSVSDNIFCVPVPFGPVEIQLTNTLITNFTWCDVRPGLYTSAGPMLATQYCNPSQISVTEAPFMGIVRGLIPGSNLTQVPYGLVTVQICPAGTPPVEYACSSAVANGKTGVFYGNGTPGWDVVSVTAPLYEANSTWVDLAVGKVTNAGTIFLTEDGFVAGQVVTQAGSGIYDASVTACPIASQGGSSCGQLGTSPTTNTAGDYFGNLAAYPLPRGAFQLLFTAAGYTSNWTWVNITEPGVTVNASTVVLYSLTSSQGTTASTPSSSSAPSTASLAEWVDGQALDNVTGIPVQGLTMSYQSPGGLANQIPNTWINNLDDYNLSLPTGVLYVNFSAPGYIAGSYFINVTGLDVNGTMFLPAIYLNPYKWITGRVVIGPSGWTALVTDKDGLGPGAVNVVACTSASVCGPTTTANLAGVFNVSAPAVAGALDTLKITPAATGTGTQKGGFVSVTAIANVSNASVQTVGLVNPIVSDIFGIIYGRIMDLSTGNLSPVRYVSATAFKGTGNTTTMLDDGGGDVIGIISPGTDITIAGFATSYLPVGLIGTNVTAGNATLMNGNLSLPHYGWVAGYIRSSPSNGTVPWGNLSVNATWGTNPGVSNSNAGIANGAGYINATAPPGTCGTIYVSAPDYNTSVVRCIEINQSRTLSLDSVLPGGSQGGIEQWGWLTGQVLDTRFHFPVDEATVNISSSYGANGASGVITNASGGFRIDAPPSPADNITASSLPDYYTNWTVAPVAFGATVNIAPVNLTGRGIVAGYVVSYPAGDPIPFANVSLCPQTDPFCPNVALANGSGYFWISGAPGLDVLNVSYTNFVSNNSKLVELPSDGWLWIGKVVLNEFAFVTGTVVGLPSGIPVNGANVSACSAAVLKGYPYCYAATQTSSSGTFLLAVQAGLYIIQVNATLYNSTFLPLSLQPGEVVALGLIDLELYGFATGTILGSDTQSPIVGAQAVACPTWSTGNCTTPAIADPATGTYSLAGPPGPYTLLASAPGYFPGSVAVSLISGNLITVPTIFLDPIGSPNRFSVSGTVLAPGAGSTTVPFAGAVISDGAGDATTSSATGAFTLWALWGQYTLTIGAPGRAAVNLPLEVHGNVSGIRVVLNPMTYEWTGTVSDGLNGQPFAEATVSVDGSTAGTTDENGMYSLALANGTYMVTVVVPGAPSIYAVNTFTLTVNGASGVRNVPIFPPSVTVYALVVDAVTGLPIADAAVQVSGTVSPEAVPFERSLSTDVLGAAQTPVFNGKYTITASATGYGTSTRAVDTSNGTVSVTVSLQPNAVPAAASSGPLVPVLGVAIAGGVVVAAVGAYVITRRLTATQSGGTAVSASSPGEP